MANELVNLNTVASPYGGDLAQIQQRQRLADMLMQQGSTQDQIPTYKGIQAHVPVTAGLAKALQQAMGVYGQFKGVEDQKALGAKMQGDASDWISKLTAPQSMSPAQPGVPEAISGAPTVAPSPGQMSPGGMTPQQRMALLLQGQQNPMTAQAAQTMMTQDAEQQRQQALQTQQEAFQRTQQQALFGQQNTIQGQQETFTKAQQDALFKQQAAIQKQNEDFQRSQGAPIQVVDPTSPTGFKYVRPEQAVGQPGFNANAPFGAMGIGSSAMPPSGGALQATPASGQQGQTAPDAAGNPTGQAVLDRLPKPIADQVKALAEGRMAFPAGFALKSPYWQQMVSMVSQYDPSFDAVNYGARAKTRNDFTSGTSAKQINAMNTVLGHMQTLSDAADAMKNTNYPMLNQGLNAAANAVGDPRMKEFNSTKKAVVDELTRVWRGNGGSEGDIKTWAEQLSDAGSPDQLHGVIGQLGELLNSKIGAMGEQYKQGMGTAGGPIQLLTPQSQKVLDLLETRAGKKAVPMGEQNAPASAPRVVDW